MLVFYTCVSWIFPKYTSKNEIYRERSVAEGRGYRWSVVSDCPQPIQTLDDANAHARRLPESFDLAAALFRRLHCFSRHVTFSANTNCLACCNVTVDRRMKPPIIKRVDPILRQSTSNEIIHSHQTSWSPRSIFMILCI